MEFSRCGGHLDSRIRRFFLGLRDGSWRLFNNPMFFRREDVVGILILLVNSCGRRDGYVSLHVAYCG
jgi:hypothetical protein